ncbi:DNA-binding response regulator [Agromyces tardus]|jgi:DNA-binding NarL/FixJ family response regulator|uniref:DNA-binding response regulator n=1 Tax=Agromyces tardus TaxID=2583849 RepID=A0A3M8A079_9MICO|nr:LuxR C-terminal-related transcriptional regulator [Agromyces tardus]RNB44638.1 DNA-binding response regulator [Agromyces tardus]
MGATPVAVMPPVAWHEVVHLRPAELRLRIERMPEATWSRDPAALLGLAMAHRSPGSTNPYAAEPYLDAADELLADGVGEPALHVLAPIVRSIPLRELGAFDQARGLLACAARELSAARLPFAARVELQAVILLNDGICATLGGRLDEGRRTLLRALHLAESRTPATLQAEACGCIALIDLRTGSLRSAVAHLTTARSAAGGSGPIRDLGSAPVRLAEIAVAMDRGQVDRLEAELSSLIAETAGTEYEPLVLAELAALREAADDDDAIDVLQELQLLIRDWDAPNLPRMMHDDTRIALLVRRHEAVAARAELAGILPDETHTQCPATWSARLALDGGAPAHAIELVAPCLAMGDAHSPRTATLARLIAAAAHAVLGDLSTADALFAQAISVAAPTGSVRQFGVVPRGQLSLLVARSRRVGHTAPVRALLDAIAARFPTGDDGASDTLSTRERVVLARLVAGDTQQRISFELSVSPNTVKTQVRSIYRKLGVTTRDGAVHRARSLGIID